MDDKTRKPDAEDKAPRPVEPKDKPSARESEQGGASQADRTDGGRAIPNDELSSANDE